MGTRTLLSDDGSVKVWQHFDDEGAPTGFAQERYGSSATAEGEQATIALVEQLSAAPEQEEEHQDD